jgi:insulysin
LKTRIYSEIVVNTLKECSYTTQLVRLNYSILYSSAGLDIQILGYNDKLPILLEQVLGIMRSIEIGQDRFSSVKEKL